MTGAGSDSDEDWTGNSGDGMKWGSQHADAAKLDMMERLHERRLG